VLAFYNCQPTLKPNKIAMMKLATNAQKNYVRRILAESFTTADRSPVSQHSGKQLCKSDNLSCLIFDVVQ
jgi:hypothetical protein